MGRLSGKAAIVTGSSRGIGKGIATVLGREGAAVVVAARSVEPRPGLAGSIGETAAAIEAAGGRAIAVACDITDAASVDALFQRTLDEFGRVDLLVNNAGGSGTFAPVEGYPMRRFDRVVALNLRGTFLCCRAAIGPMTRQGGGVIVNVSSDSAQKLAFPDDAIYGMVKAGMERLTLGLGQGTGGARRLRRRILARRGEDRGRPGHPPARLRLERLDRPRRRRPRRRRPRHRRGRPV